MKDEEINIAIAEACGRVRRPDGYWFPEGKSYGSSGIHNYANDLNAMHEAEKATFTNGPYWGRYFDALADVCDCECDAITATARQRAEAFLRTIGKWKEEA